MASCCRVCKVTRLVLSWLTSATVSLLEPPWSVLMYCDVKARRVCKNDTLAPSVAAADWKVEIVFDRALYAMSKAEVWPLLTAVEKVVPASLLAITLPRFPPEIDLLIRRF